MRRSIGGAVALVLATAACGGGSLPATTPDRASGQSGLMSGTFAGQNACNPKSHDRPFVVEWDGTDMSQLESIAAYDTVFVSYHGCDLKIVDTCRNDSQKGQLGAYRPVEWTSGSVEKIDVRNEGELFAKLPLGAATLASRVKGGESFVMEYFVAGTRTSTRAEIHEGELTTRPGCKDVTHYVYAYNLGAFALGSKKTTSGEASAGALGIGGGGAAASERSAEKKGGSLSACRGDSAKEVSGCKTPIRLTLRAIAGGSATDVLAAAAPETADAKNLAGKIQRERTDATSAEGHIRASEEKQIAKDFAGALAEYDAYDKLEPDATKHTTNPSSKYSQPRANVLMQLGQCEAGRELYRKSLEKMGFSPAIADQSTSDAIARSCNGSKGITPREELVRAMRTLHDGHFPPPGGTVEAKSCKDAYAAVKRLEGQVKPQGEPELLLFPGSVWEEAPACFAKANDCATGLAVYKERNPRRRTDAENKSEFERKFPSCVGK